MILKNISQYTANKGKYKAWKENRELEEAKKIEYLKKNPVSETQKMRDIKRAKAVLHAVDTMDEFSQTRAEDMEQLTEQFRNGLAEISSYIGLGCALLTLKLTKSFDAFTDFMSYKSKNITKLIPAIIAFIIPCAICDVYATFVGTKAEIRASRLGRTEAMTNDLSSSKQFAVLNEEQEKEVENRAKDIEVTKSEIKRSTNAGKGMGILSSAKMILFPDKKLEEDLVNYSDQVDNEIKNADKVVLSEEEIEQAKKDKELIQNIVQQIDIKSQDYAENAEFITGTITTVAFGAGGLTGLIVNKLGQLFKFSKKQSKIAGFITGTLLTLAITIASTKVQKGASRVGRYVAKKEMLNNPESFIYVDSDKYKNETVELPKNKKEGFIARTIKLFKETDEYKKDVKKNREINLKRRKAIDELKLSDKQLKDAQQLQRNVFKMFNKVDEKSQAFSESIEATGDSISALISLIASLPATLFFINAFAPTGKNKITNIVKAFTSLLPAIIFNIFVTKEQKKASRVADMLAIKELDNYKHFAPESSYKSDNSVLNNKNKEIKSFNNEPKKDINREVSPTMQAYIEKIKNKTI